jgi:hypothetical protein
MSTEKELHDEQVQRERELARAYRQSAHRVLVDHASRHNWPADDVAEVVGMLGLEEDRGPCGAVWAEFTST